MTTAARMAATSEAAAAVTIRFAAEAALARTPHPEPAELGGLAWLADLDADDRREALSELRGAVVAAITTDDPQPLRDALHGWQTTARVMRDRRRREALLAVPGDDEFVEVTGPAAGNAD